MKVPDMSSSASSSCLTKPFERFTKIVYHLKKELKTIIPSHLFNQCIPGCINLTFQYSILIEFIQPEGQNFSYYSPSCKKVKHIIQS